MFFLIVSVLLVFYTLCQPLVSQTLRFTYPEKDKVVYVHMCVCVHSAYVYVCLLSGFSHVQLFATLWIVAHQAPLSMGFLRQEYWSGLPFPSSGDLSD